MSQLLIQLTTIFGLKPLTLKAFSLFDCGLLESRGYFEAMIGASGGLPCWPC